jgi:hypothetical protein
MKKLIVAPLIMAGMILTAGFFTLAQAQSPASDLKPTFISPTPGLYVNGWPAFTVTYPKEWVEMATQFSVFKAGTPRPDLPPSPGFDVIVLPSEFPLEEWAKQFMPIWVQVFRDIKVLSDKPSRLKDGTPAREVEFEFVPKYDAGMAETKNVPKHNGLLLATKEDVKDRTLIAILLTDDKGLIGPVLKEIAYSLTFQPDREKPVNVPPDVQAFLDMWGVDMVSHDVGAVMAHYSDRFLWSGVSKPVMEQWLRNDPHVAGFISFEPTVTIFEARGDKAYIDGFSVVKTKTDPTPRRTPMGGNQIINEHGQWKLYGNQK